MAESIGFHLHHSNQLERLARTLGENLVASEIGNVLSPDVVLIPQPSMRRWLQKSLAEQFGIAANIEFLPPGSFINQQLEAWLPKQLPLLSPELLRWRLFALLQDESLMLQAVFLPIAGFLHSGDSQLRAWQLAGELSEAFEKYQAWRKHWLINWHHQQHPFDWQAQLFFLASQGHCFRAQAFQNYFKAIDHETVQKPTALPERLFIFACQSVSPDVLRVLRSLARWSQVHFYLHNPCLAYWGDVQKPQNAEQLIALQGDNALLNQCGRAGRDFVANLLSEQSPFDIEDHADYQEFDTAPNMPALSLLQQLQSDILQRQSASIQFPAFSTDWLDDSVQIHSCHTPLREVQVLRTQLLALFEKHPELMPSDVVVMAPQLEAYAPYFEAIFNQQQGPYAALPFAISDQNLFAESKLAQLFFRLLALAKGRFTSNEGFELLSHSYIASYFGLQKSDLNRIHFWLEQAEVRWGINGAHRKHIDGVAQSAFTWQHGLQRLLLGYVGSQTDCIDDLAPILAPIGQDQVLLDALFEFNAFIEHVHMQLNQNMSALQWQTLLQEILQKFTASQVLEDSELETQRRLNLKISQLPKLNNNAGQSNLIGIAMISDYLNDEGEQRLSQAWLSGRITVCKMVPMRLIPFKVICLLGMNENDFPRQEQSAAINLLLSKQQPKIIGDRNNREDDRFLFLQLLSACQQHFYLSYIGRSAKDDAELSPSILIKELLDSLSGYFPNSQQVCKQFIMQQPLQVFEAHYQTDARMSLLHKPQQAQAVANLALFAPVFSQASEQATKPITIAIEQLKSFWQRPIQQLAGNQGLRLNKHELRLEENEPYGQFMGLSAYHLEQHILENGLNSKPKSDNALITHLQAQGLLSPGRLGFNTFHAHADRLKSTIATLSAQRIEPKIWPIDLNLPSARIQGELTQNFSAGLIHIRGHKDMGAKQHIRSGFEALLVVASELPVECLDYAKNKLVLRDKLLSPQQAQQSLENIAALYLEGQSKILCFDPEPSFAFYMARNENPDLQVVPWLQEMQAKENEEFMPSFDQSLDFLTYGQGFLTEIALKNPEQFETLALQIFKPLMGVASHE
ncbi:MAG: exodeoxyribonuclease V subunit gamma [Arenimonas sp.]|nr:exodeoxyribonuclease V subunit gamma [Arenimonas sp.]